MNRFEQRKLIKNLICLRRAIQRDVGIITDKLYQRGIFTTETKHEIMNAPNSLKCNTQVQCGILINKLIRSGKEAYVCFKMILEDLGYHKVIQMMEKSQDRDLTDSNPVMVEDKERTFVLPNYPTANSTKRQNNERTERPGSFECCTSSGTTEEIQQLNRMVTFVLNRTDKTTEINQSNNNDNINGFILQEVDACDEMCKTFNYNEFNYTPQQLAH